MAVYSSSKIPSINLDPTEPDSVLMIQDRSDDPDSTLVSADPSSPAGSSIDNTVITTNNASVSYMRCLLLVVPM